MNWARTLFVCVLFIFCFCTFSIVQAAGTQNIRNTAIDHGVKQPSNYGLTKSGMDEATAEGISQAAGAGAVIAGSTIGATAAGAGSLAGYAGMASAVSSLGLGGLTTAGASLLGSSATGAAATAVCTAAVGGPVVMGAIVIGVVGGTGYGIYKGAQYVKNSSAGQWASEKKNKMMNWLKEKF